MPWEYLDSHDFGIRKEIVRSILSIHTLGLNVAIDINCGSNADFYRYMPDMFDTYYGNDVSAEKDIKGGRAWLHKCDDKDILPYIEEFMSGLIVNVVMLLGDGAGDFTNEDVESKTSRETLKKVIERFTPKLFIYETVEKFVNDYGILKEVADFMFISGYECVLIINLDIGTNNDFINKRVFAVYKRNINEG